MDQRRYTYNKDLLWILDHLSQHGKIIKLQLGFGGRRNVRMCTRDGDFLKALKGVKTDKLSIGDTSCLDNHSVDVRFSHSMLPLPIQSFSVLGSLVQSMLTSEKSLQRWHVDRLDPSAERLLELVLVRPLPLKELDPRLKF